MEELDVACVGIVVVDVLSSVLPKLPDPGELISVEDIYLASGGCAPNTAVSLRKLGAKAGVVGKAGADVFGDFVVDYLKTKNVDAAMISRSEKLGTSKTIILLTENEDRRFIHTFGANADFAAEDINFDYISQAKALYVGGYLDLPKLSQKSLIELLKFARERDIVTFLDVVVPHPDPGLINECKEALSYTDYFLPNEDEARILTGKKNPKEQAEAFLQYNPQLTAVITMGKNGALVRTKEKIIQAGSYRVKVVDPSGGGDAFDAGFIFGILQGWDLEKTLQFASATGASAVTAIGCTTGVFDKNAALDFTEKNELKMTITEESL